MAEFPIHLYYLTSLLPSLDVLSAVITLMGYTGKAKEKGVKKEQTACTRQEMRQKGVQRVERVPDGFAKPEGFA